MRSRYVENCLTMAWKSFRPVVEKCGFLVREGGKVVGRERRERAPFPGKTGTPSRGGLYEASPFIFSASSRQFKLNFLAQIKPIFDPVNTRIQPIHPIPQAN